MEIRAAALSRGCFACRQSSPLREAHGRNMIAEAACGRSSLSEKAGCAGLFRQDTFPLRLGARPGKRAGKPCCARFPNPPHMSPGSDCIWRASALQASPKGFFDGLNGRHAKELPPRAAPEKRHMFPETRRKPHRPESRIRRKWPSTGPRTLVCRRGKVYTGIRRRIWHARRPGLCRAACLRKGGSVRPRRLRRPEGMAFPSALRRIR